MRWAPLGNDSSIIHWNKRLRLNQLSYLVVKIENKEIVSATAATRLAFNKEQAMRFLCCCCCRSRNRSLCSLFFSLLFYSKQLWCSSMPCCFSWHGEGGIYRRERVKEEVNASKRVCRDDSQHEAGSFFPLSCLQRSNRQLLGQKLAIYFFHLESWLLTRECMMHVYLLVYLTDGLMAVKNLV